MLNSTVNLHGNPSQFVPPDGAESNPNVSVSGFIDESPCTGPGTHLQLQLDGIETRIVEVIGWFEGLKLEINEWENFLERQKVSVIEINRQFKSLAKVIHDIANQALLARVDIPTWGAISNLKNV